MTSQQATRHLTTKRLSDLAGFAILGQLVLLASAWLLPLQSDYGPVGDTISELVLGRLGFVQTAAFVTAGLGTVGLAVVIRQLTVDSRGAFIGARLVGVYGVGAVLSAVFRTDRIDNADDLSSLSTTGTIHITVAFLSFIAITAGMFLVTRTFMRQPPWRPTPWWWMSFPAGTLALLVAQAQGPIVGLMQRLLVLLVSSWLILVALRIRANTTSVHTTRPELANR